jgi:hypothetical protein
VIHDTDLTGTIPSEIGLLRKVQTFELFENFVSGSISDGVQEVLRGLSATQCSLQKNCLDPAPNYCQGQVQRNDCP